MKYLALFVISLFFTLSVQAATDITLSPPAASTEYTLRDQLSIYRCQLMDCAKEQTFFFSTGDTDPLSVFSDFQTVQKTKRAELAAKRKELIEYREFRKTQDEVARLQAAPEAPCETGKCILVVLSRQMTYAYEDGQLKFSSATSTGVPGHATPVGTFHVYGKTAKQKMSGPGYYLPNVPWILWFKGDYSLHGAYWHNNFGHVMSHGCVNLPIARAKEYFDFAPVGTPVIIRQS